MFWVPPLGPGGEAWVHTDPWDTPACLAQLGRRWGPRPLPESSKQWGEHPQSLGPHSAPQLGCSGSIPHPECPCLLLGRAGWPYACLAAPVTEARGLSVGRGGDQADSREGGGCSVSGFACDTSILPATVLPISQVMKLRLGGVRDWLRASRGARKVGFGATPVPLQTPCPFHRAGCVHSLDRDLPGSPSGPRGSCFSGGLVPLGDGDR